MNLTPDEFLSRCARICLEDEQNMGTIVEDGKYYLPLYERSDYEQWCSEFTHNVLYPPLVSFIREGAPNSDKRYYERISAFEKPIKLSMILPWRPLTPSSIKQSVNFSHIRISIIEHVTRLFAPQFAAVHGMSLWYRDDDTVYVVWPNFALNISQLKTVLRILEPLMPERCFAHITDNYGDVRFPLFPLPNTRLLNLYDEKGEPAQYNWRVHRACAHLVQDGGFNRRLEIDPEAANESLEACWIKWFEAMRLSNMEGCVRPNSQALKPHGLGMQFQVAHAQVMQALHPPAPVALPQPGTIGRLTFDDPNDFYDPFEAVRTLANIINSLADPFEHTPVIDRLNRWFVVERYKGKTTIWQKSLELQRYLRDPEHLVYYGNMVATSVQDIRGRLDGLRLQVKLGNKVIYKNPVDLWLTHPDCNTVSQVVINMQPSTHVLVNPYENRLTFNNWRGFDFYRTGRYAALHDQYRTWSLKDLHDKVAAIRDLNALVYGALCSCDVAAFRALTLLLGNVLQFPNNPARKAVIIRGAEGVGKSMLTSALVKRGLGFEHSAVFTDPGLVVGNFNAALSGKALSICEEAFFGGNKEGCGRLQQTITGDWQLLNEKFEPTKIEWNNNTFIMNSNKGFVAQINKDGRRYLVTEVNDLVTNLTADQKTEFFADLVAHVEGDGLFLYMYFLARLNLKEWMEKRSSFILHNQALALQKSKSMLSELPIHSWLDDCYYKGQMGVRHGTDAKTGNPTTTVFPFDRHYDLATLKKFFDDFQDSARGSYRKGMADFLNDVNDILSHLPGYVGDVEALAPGHEHYVGEFRYLYIPDREQVHFALCKAVPGLDMAMDTSHKTKRRKVNKEIAAQEAPVHVTDLLPSAEVLIEKQISEFEYLFGGTDSIIMSKI